MTKICPYCDGELETGYIQCRDGVIWTKKKRKVAALPSLSKSSITLSWGGGVFSGASVVAYCCRSCEKIIINYSDLE